MQKKLLQSKKQINSAQRANSICYDLPLHDNLGESWEEMIHIDKNLMRDSQLTSRPDQHTRINSDISITRSNHHLDLRI